MSDTVSPAHGTMPVPSVSSTGSPTSIRSWSDRHPSAPRRGSVPGRPPRFAVGAFGLLVLVAGGCSGGGAQHPWLDLSDSPFHEILEVSGASSGQLVILVPEGASYTEVMALGERIAAEAPPGATVNARIFDDRQTALGWRTAPAAWTVQHLLAVVTGVPEAGVPEVRWVGPEERIPPEVRQPDEVPVESSDTTAAIGEPTGDP